MAATTSSRMWVVPVPKWYKVVLVLLLDSVLLPAFLELSFPQFPAGCQVERAVTVPAPVDMAEVL